MPLAIVTVSRKCKELSDFSFDEYSCIRLRRAIAAALSCGDEGGFLALDDIEIEIKDRDEKKNFGGEKYDVKVIIFANEYPSRRASLRERCDEIQKYLSCILPETVTGYVWVLLSPAAFAEFC